MKKPLAEKYRPTTLDGIVGQAQAVRLIKRTLARSWAAKLPDGGQEHSEITSWQYAKARSFRLARKYGLRLTHDKRLGGKRYATWFAVLDELERHREPKKPAWVDDLEPARKGPPPAPKAARGLPDWMATVPYAVPVTESNEAFDKCWQNVLNEVMS